MLMSTFFFVFKNKTSCTNLINPCLSRSTGSVTTGSTVNSGPNSLTPGTANGLPPPPSTQGGGGGGGSGRSSQLGGGGSQSGGETRYGGTELVMLYDYKVNNYAILHFVHFD